MNKIHVIMIDNVKLKDKIMLNENRNLEVNRGWKIWLKDFKPFTWLKKENGYRRIYLCWYFIHVYLISFGWTYKRASSKCKHQTCVSRRNKGTYIKICTQAKTLFYCCLYMLFQSFFKVLNYFLYKLWISLQSVNHKNMHVTVL